MVRIILFSILVVILASIFASSHPDGLEKVAGQLGFINRGEGHSFNAPIPDYLFPGIGNEVFATVLAGITGVLLILGSSFIFSIIKK